MAAITSIHKSRRSQSIDPPPPCNPQAERNFLGAVMVDPEQARFCDLLDVNDFYTESRRPVFVAIQSLRTEGKPIDSVLVVDRLYATEMLELAGGQAEVSALATNIVATANAEYYARIIAETGIRRQKMGWYAALSRAINDDDGATMDEAQDHLNQLDERMQQLNGADDDAAPASNTPLRAMTLAETFPVEALPPAMRDLVRSASHAIPCAPDMVALPALVAAATAIGHSWAMRVKKGYIEPPIIYAAIVAQPADGKTPAVNYALTPIYQRQDREMADYRAVRKEWDAKLADERTGDEPLLTQLYATDTTIEALSDALQNARSIVVIKDEIHAWVAGMDAYKAKGRGSERDAWLTLWRAGKVMINRRNRDGALYLSAPHTNVVGGIQEDRLIDLDDEKGRADGFVDRLLFAYPRPTELRHSKAEVDGETEHRYAALIDDLYGLGLAVSGEGKSETNYASFTAEGATEYDRWCEGLYAEMNDPNFPLAQRGVWKKLQAYLCRLTLILHLCRTVNHDPGDHVIRGHVDGVDVAHAVALIEYFKRAARKTLARLHAQPQDLRLLGALEWIRRQPDNRTTARELLSNNVGGVNTTEDAKTLLKELAEHGYGEISERHGRGRPSTVFTLKPLFAAHVTPGVG